MKSHSSASLYKIYNIIGTRFSNNDIRTFIDKGQLSGLLSAGYIMKTGETIESTAKKYSTIPIMMITRKGMTHLKTYKDGFVTEEDRNIIEHYKSTKST